MKKLHGSWYKFSGKHGLYPPSTTIKYVYLTTDDLKNISLKDRWMEIFDEYSAGFPGVKGTTRKVKYLPENVKQQKIENYKCEITCSQKMLKILENTPIK